jgi:hypothetical protein
MSQVACPISMKQNDLLMHAKTKHNIDTFNSISRNFNFQLDELTTGEGHWRMFLRSHNDTDCSYCSGSADENTELCPSLVCVLLIGYKSSDDQISLCARSVLPNDVGRNYSIQLNLAGRNVPTRMQAKLRGLHEPLGSEAKAGDCLTLDGETVRLMQQLKNTTQCKTVMTVSII